MYNFIFQTIIVVALGAMIYLTARALPRVPAEIETAPRGRTADLLERLIARLPLKKLDAATSSFLEKFLRRVRLFVLKFDNWIHHSITTIRATTNDAVKESSSVPLAELPAEPQPPAVIEQETQAVEKPEEPPSSQTTE